MRTGLYKGLSNEELVELYKAGESDAFEALLKNTEGLRATLAQRYLNIPGSEFEDLMSEGAIMKAFCDEYYMETVKLTLKEMDRCDVDKEAKRE